MKCLKCSKEGARISSYDTSFIIHKCSDILLEVGKVFENNFYELSPSFINVEGLSIQKISKEELNYYVKDLAPNHLRKNEVNSLVNTECFIVWRNDFLEYIIICENKELMNRHFFGYKGTIPNYKDIILIKKTLKFFSYLN